MATMVSKRYDASAAKIAPDKPYSLDEAIGVLKAMPGAKFDESVDLSFRLGVDPKHADQMVRGAVVARARRNARRARPGPTRSAPRISSRRCRAAGWTSTRPSPRPI